MAPISQITRGGSMYCSTSGNQYCCTSAREPGRNALPTLDPVASARIETSIAAPACEVP